jgi:pyrroline-5-carboxylate reductase
MIKQPKLGFIGAGNLSRSLIGGLIASGYKPDQIWSSNRHKDKLDALLNSYPIHTTLSNTELIQEVDVVILAVKPKDARPLIDECSTLIQARLPLIVSVMAGITCDQLERWLGFKTAIVRAIPNTPALLRVGATGLYANLRVSSDQKDLAETLLRSVGITEWLNHEHDLDIVTLLSGCGPAYFLLVMEILQKTAESFGLPSSIATSLTLQTALGASRIALESNVDLTELKNQIATPGGVTEKALSTLEEQDLRLLFKSAFQAAKDRLNEISHLLEQE